MWNPSLFCNSDDKDKLLFQFSEHQSDNDAVRPTSGKPINILVVDDDEDIHQVTHMVLDDYRYRDQQIQLLDAYSANHAKQLLEQHPDIAVILLDVVMETDHAGLDLVNYIRSVLNNNYVRIILRTGQPGQAPELQVVRDYDIHDYRDKSELTAGKLISAVTAAIRSYQDIRTIESMAMKVSNLEAMVAERTQQLQTLNRELEHRVEMRTEELHKALQVAEQASQAKSVFLSRVSHELRTPMNAILGFAQLLQLNFSETMNHDQNEYVDEIIKGGNHLLALINELLDISRIERGELQLKIENFTIVDLLSEIQHLLQPLMDSKHIKFDTSLCLPDEFTIVGDRTRFKQVLINLLGNATKYNKENGNIVMNCDHDDENITISIRDSGIGIAKEDIDNIFIPFIRVNPYSSVEGTGIGLAVCKQIIEAMGGTIGVDSELGQGSRFWFTVPLQA